MTGKKTEGSSESICAGSLCAVDSDPDEARDFPWLMLIDPEHDPPGGLRKADLFLYRKCAERINVFLTEEG